MSLDAEIIVVGAGPAGSVAATILARNNHDVFLIDKSNFPRKKHCGDALAPSTLAVLYRYGLQEVIQQAGFYPIHAVRIEAPNGRSLIVNFSTENLSLTPLTAPRFQFDDLLNQAARNSGARFLKGRVLGPVYGKDGICGVTLKTDDGQKELRSKLVIAADGSDSIFAKALNPGLRDDRRRAVAIRGYAQNFTTNPHTIEGIVRPDFWPGYAWIFPTGPTSVNIGFGKHLDDFRNSKESLKKQLDVLIRSPRIAERFGGDIHLTEIGGASLTMGSSKMKQRVFDGALLIGDAAALINPLSGAGIANGIISAEIATNIAEKALSRGDLSRSGLREYELEIHKLLRREFQFAQIVQKWLYQSTAGMNWAITRLPASPVFRLLIEKFYPDLKFETVSV